MSTKSIIVTIILISFAVWILYSNTLYVKEAFGSSSYNSCIGSGYTKEFCLQNPPFPGSCICKNGNPGVRMPGFRGRCVCLNSFT